MIVRWHSQIFRNHDASMHTIAVVPGCHSLPIWIDCDVSIAKRYEGFPDWDLPSTPSKVEYTAPFACFGGISGHGLYIRLHDKQPEPVKKFEWLLPYGQEHLTGDEGENHE